MSGGEPFFGNGLFDHTSCEKLFDRSVDGPGNTLMA